MSSEMEWSHDFCLYCDRQTTEGIYCSQACRLADLEKAGSTEPHSPLHFASSTPDGKQWASWGSAATAGATNGFHLPPAVNWAYYKPATQTTFQSPIPRSNSTPHALYYQPTVGHVSTSSWTAPSSTRRLSPSSSRSSLTSVSGSPNAQGLSDNALNQLRAYGNSFDQIRDLKRRVTLT